MSLPEIVQAHPPRLLQGYRCGPAKVESDKGVYFIGFSISCGACAATHLTLHAFRGPDGETNGLVASRCAGCGQTRKLFDWRSHGWDGEVVFDDPETPLGALADLDSYQGPGSFTGQFTLSFTYNIDLDELQETATDNQKQVADLFDWFNILCGGEQVWDWECA